MPTKSGFNPDDFLPRFLSDEPLSLVDEPLLLADEPDEQDIGKAWDRAVISSRVLTASILVATATAIGIAILSVGNRVTLLADVTASQVDTADAQALPPTAKDAPTRDEIAAASEPAGQNQTEKNEVPEALFRQFQASAAEKDTQAQVGQPIQETSGRVAQHVPAQVAENGPASVRPMQRHRHVRAVQNARAEIRPVQNPRKLRREQNARLQTPPAQRARAQDQSAQNAQAAPWLLQALGWRN